MAANNIWTKSDALSKSNCPKLFKFIKVVSITQEKKISQIYAQNMLNLVTQGKNYMQCLDENLTWSQPKSHTVFVWKHGFEPSSAYFGHKFGLFVCLE